MTPEEYAQLSDNAKVNIWLATKCDARPFRNMALETCSRGALHYGLGGAIKEVAHGNVILRSGLLLQRLGAFAPRGKFAGVAS